MVASLSVPWGDTGNERSGYHLVWPRDLVECATALLAFGGEAEARNTLRYLIATQNVEDTGSKTNGWAANPIGAGSNSTKRRIRFSWPLCSPTGMP